MNINICKCKYRVPANTNVYEHTCAKYNCINTNRNIHVHRYTDLVGKYWSVLHVYAWFGSHKESEARYGSGKVAQWVKVLAVKPDDPSSVLRTTQ